jgi:antitoxin YefM
MLTKQVSYTSARENLASLLDQIENDNTIAVITRRGHKDIAMLPAEELESLLETVYLLRSPKNAKKLFAALERSKQRSDRPLQPESIEQLCQELGIER